MLEKECNSTSYENFTVSLNGTTPFASVAANATVAYCNYYEVGAGYQFTQANNGIGLVVLPSEVGSARDIYFRDLVLESGILYWDWQALAELIEAYTQPQCLNATASSGSNSSGVLIPDGLEAIVQWITKYAEIEIKDKCDAFGQ